MREDTLAFSKDFLPGEHLSTCHRCWRQHERSRVQSELSDILEELPQILMECVEKTEQRFHLVDAGVCKKLIGHVEIEDFVVGKYFVANVPISRFVNHTLRLDLPAQRPEVAGCRLERVANIRCGLVRR